MKTFSILTVLFLSLILISCGKDESSGNSLYQTWEAKNFISFESVTYPKNENTSVLLAFKTDGTYSLKLDINSCSGSFISEKSNQLEIEAPACTEACCDSKFSGKLASVLSGVTSFRIEGRTLKLDVPQWGYIEFELVK